MFALLESSGSGKTVPLVADNLFDLLMIKLNTFYKSTKQTKIESRGPRFEAGDFIVKLGSVTMGPTFKGVLVEVGLELSSSHCPVDGRLFFEPYKGMINIYILGDDDDDLNGRHVHSRCHGAF